MTQLDDTHRGDLTSWVESAGEPGTDFPIQNLPFGVFSRPGMPSPRVGIAIGDQILDVVAARREGVLGGSAAAAAAQCDRPRLNELMALGPRHASALRRAASELLRADAAAYRRDPAVADRILVPMREAVLHVPAEIGDYTDFYASIHHATNVGSMFRPDQPLLPNYKWVPIGYHGRASSVVPSGAPVRRPFGQTRDGSDGAPTVAATRRLDYELEVGVFIGQGNELGTPIPIDAAERHIFGLCLVNDWSARDIQTWEYQPLGPFLAKNFATTVSPWVVTAAALEPYRAHAYQRPPGDPAPLPYLSSESDLSRGGIDITLEAWLTTERMRAQGKAPYLVSRGSFTDMYWTIAQLVAHHTVNGCNLRPGDLLASGTVSGRTKESRGCLLERTWRGTEPLALPSGESRAFLQDGDEVTLRGYCQRSGFARIGFGECKGRIVG
ncbi:MAG TPA: fumarylacetoacetase [Gemmatimonadaceae bacterium]